MATLGEPEAGVIAPVINGPAPAPAVPWKRNRWWVVGAILLAAALMAAFMMKRGPSAAQMARALGAAVVADSQGWFVNRYDKDSMSGFKVVDRPAMGVYIVRADYTFNGGTPGWVMARLIGGKVQCLQYWDRDFCRIVDPTLTPPDQNVVLNQADTTPKESDQTLRDCAFNHGFAGALCKDAGIGLDADHDEDHQ